MDERPIETYTDEELVVVDVILMEVEAAEQAMEAAYHSVQYTTAYHTTEWDQHQHQHSTNHHHYVGGLAPLGPSLPNVSFSGLSDFDLSEDWDQDHSTFAPLQDASLLKVPAKANRTIERFVSRSALRKIHPDPDVARELCLIFLSNLSSTFHSGRWKRLYSVILRRQVSFTDDSTYVRIVEVLKDGTPKLGSILHVIKDARKGKSYEYALGDAYYGKGIVPYTLKTEHAVNLRNREHYRLYAEASDNPIARNLFRIYSVVRPPLKEEIHAEAKKLISMNFKSKKGKELTYLHRHDKGRWERPEERMFVEDCLDIYEICTGGGFLMPIVTDEKAGGRVVDSFTLMPGWIRNMTTVNGERLVEVDYAALHPNLAVAVYGGNAKYITHRGLAEKAGVDPGAVKKEHLSFFNKRWKDLVKSPVFDFYCETEPELMDAMWRDKHDKGHKSTSRKLFALEVTLMTNVITQLNSEGIFVLYIYDAVMCEPRHKARVVAVMNDAAVEMGIYTTAK